MFLLKKMSSDSVLYLCSDQHQLGGQRNLLPYYWLFRNSNNESHSSLYLGRFHEPMLVRYWHLMPWIHCYHWSWMTQNYGWTPDFLLSLYHWLTLHSHWFAVSQLYRISIRYVKWFHKLLSSWHTWYNLTDVVNQEVQKFMSILLHIIIKLFCKVKKKKKIHEQQARLVI